MLARYFPFGKGSITVVSHYHPGGAERLQCKWTAAIAAQCQIWSKVELYTLVLVGRTTGSQNRTEK